MAVASYGPQSNSPRVEQQGSNEGASTFSLDGGFHRLVGARYHTLFFGTSRYALECGNVHTSDRALHDLDVSTQIYS